MRVGILMYYIRKLSLIPILISNKIHGVIENIQIYAIFSKIF